MSHETENGLPAVRTECRTGRCVRDLPNTPYKLL